MRQRLAALMMAMCLALAGCGGGGGGGGVGQTATTTAATSSGSSAPGGPVSTLSGTAAKGVPLVNATVTVTDANGLKVTAQTAGDGTYKVDVTGLQPPFLITVTDGQTTLHGIAFGPGTANITPVSDMALTVFFQAQGTTLQQALSDPNGAPLPSEGGMQRVMEAILAQMREAFAQHGLDPDTFDPLESEFEADHTGFDALLDQIVFTGPNSFQIPGGPFTITVTLSTLPGGIVRITCVVHDNATGAETTQQFDTVVGDDQTNPQLDPAVQGVDALLAQLTATINTKGGALTSADILPYLTQDFSDDGVDRNTFASTFAAEFAGVAVDSMKVSYVFKFEPEHNLLYAHYAVTLTSDPTPYFKRMVFQLSPDGAWRFRGNKAALEESDLVRLVNGRFISATGDSGFKPTAVVDMRAPQGMISGLVVSDPSNLFFSPSGTQVAPLAQADITMGAPFDVFLAERQANAFPSPANLFGIDVTLLGLGTQHLDVEAENTTTDTIAGYALTVASQPPSHQGGAVFSGPATLSWTPPATFGLVREMVIVTLRTANYMGEMPVEVTPGTHSVTIPPPPMGLTLLPPHGAEPVLDVTYRLVVRGSADQTVMVKDVYEAPPPKK